MAQEQEEYLEPVHGASWPRGMSTFDKTSASGTAAEMRYSNGHSGVARTRDDGNLASWRPIFPEKTRRRDCKAILSGTARFIAKYGYWPGKRELAKFLGAAQGPTFRAIFFLRDAGFLELIGTGNTAGSQLTKMGWDAVGAKPIEPWAPRPVGIMAKIARRAAVELQMLMQKEQVH